MSFTDWLGTIGAVWLAVSILLAAAWVLVGRRIFRKPPAPPKVQDALTTATRRGDMDAVIAELKRRERKRGGA